MAFQPWFQNMTSPSWQVTLNTDSGAENLTGIAASALSLIIRRVDVNPPVDQAGAGSFVITQANPAIITYTINTADVAVAGNFQLFFKCAFSNGTAFYDPITFNITPD